MDYMWVKKLCEEPILHIKDSATGLSAATIAVTRDQDVAAKLFTLHWVNIHGPPRSISTDNEFDNEDIRAVLGKHGTKFKARPSRRHNKTGGVESSNLTIRLFTQRLLQDAQYELSNRGIRYLNEEILSKAVYLKNIMYGQKRSSSFKLARGFTPMIAGLPQMPVPDELVPAYHEQVVRRAICKLAASRTPRTMPKSMLPPGTPIYFFEKQTKFGKRSVGFVVLAEDYLVQVRGTKSRRGKVIKVGYEDIRLLTKSSLLYEMDKIELERNSQPRPGDGSTEHEEATNKAGEITVRFSERTLGSIHQQISSKYEPQRSYHARAMKLEAPSLDICKPTMVKNVKKDVGDIDINAPSQYPELLESQEQDILRGMKVVLGDEQVPLSRLDFVPRWLVDKAINAEKANYAEKEAYTEADIRSLPRKANLITSHCFFHVKTDGTTNKLKLKCRLVAHGNKDRERFDLRKDSTTAQFPVIRSLLSAAAILKLRLATIDISGAFLQSGPLERDVYVRLPSGWAESSFIVWKLLKPAYGLVESGRLWQLAVEEWMFNKYGVNIVIGLVQLFVERDKDNNIVLSIAKVVDDFLLAGNPESVRHFHNAISKRFKVGRFGEERTLIFNRLTITQEEEFSINVSMGEYLSTIESLKLIRSRRKQPEAKCTREEITAFLGISGKLNWLGHGALRPATYVASMLQQYTGDLRVEHLKIANSALHEIRRLAPDIRYSSPRSIDTKSAYLTFSDASHNRTTYGQTGYLSGIYFNDQIGTYHLLDWHSSKQGRVSFSSIGAEILAAAEACDRGSMMASSLHSLYASKDALPMVLTADSHGLYTTMSTLHQSKDYRLRPTVSRMRDSFESKEIAVIQWVRGKNNLADALTKRNCAMYEMLNKVFTSGRIPSTLFEKAERALERHLSR